MTPALRASLAALVFALTLLASGLTAAAETVCAMATPCVVGAGRYVALPPPDWNGRDALRLGVWLHGFRQPIGDIAGDSGLVAQFQQRRQLLVVPEAPDGQGWSMKTGPNAGRDDVSFLRAVSDDVKRRFPVAGGSTLMGFSNGAMMVWSVACDEPRAFDHYVAFSGTWWVPYPSGCADGPVDFIHIHGTTDTTVPIEGRSLRGGQFRQGDLNTTLPMLAKSRRCETPPSPIEDGAGGLQCRAWSDCAAGSALVMCLHPGAHWVDPQWAGWALDRLAKPAP